MCIKIFFQGQAKECRLKVQELRAIKSTQQNEADNKRLNEIYEQQNNEEDYDDEYYENENEINQENFQEFTENHRPKENKWAKYLTEEDLNYQKYF